MSPLPSLLTLALSVAPSPSAGECLELLHGIGRPRDPAAARACLEAALPSPCPDSGSPDLARGELAAMYLDGQGGPAAPEKAWELLRGCFEDATVLGLREAFADRAPTGAFDFCREVGGTTLTINECTALEAEAQLGARSAAAGRLAARLPPAARPPLDAAERAWTMFLEAAAEVAADEVRGGTAATSFRRSAEAALARERARWLDGLAALRPGSCDADALRAEDARLGRAYQRVRKEQDADGRALLRDAQRAWMAARDADAALAAAWKGAALELAVRCLQTRARARALEASAFAEP